MSGDLHHHHILDAGGRYLVIDPKPMLGEPEYDEKEIEVLPALVEGSRFSKAIAGAVARRVG